MPDQTITINPEKFAQLDEITISDGAHESFEEGACSMEIVSWLADEGFTDAPACASPVLRRYVIRLNDRWDDEQRQALKPYLPRMVGTGDDGKEPARERIAATSRDALATALDAILARCHPVDAPSPMSLQDADALIRSGTVLDLAALADDDAVVRAATLREVADRLDTWEFPPGSDALEPMYRLVTALRSEAAALAAVSAAPAPEAADR